MTREQAIAVVERAQAARGGGVTGWLVEALVDLGLLHLQTTDDATRIAAAERLTGAFTLDFDNHAVRISRPAAYEIIDVLTKSGFKITREGI